ncbi:unannotated protein [freshwater metagenome]|uniref:Unannotated protein n=1 Tax=freshwater metagenome TaxID=449393 RepID=A0A6J7VJL7_9ZZZZ|nr:hypothetical protein [Actinomycetota bacterium]
MNSYIVVATFKDGVTPEDIRALIPAEQAQAKLLVEQGLLGFIKVAMPKRTVFIEAFGEDDASVLATIETLPFIAIWNIEIFPTTLPAGVNF